MTGADGESFGRRRLLGLFGTATVVGAAGCLDGFGTSDDAGTNGDGDDGTDDREFEPNLEHPGDAPLEFSDDQQCPVCGMTPTRYERWHSQIAHENGEGAVFDTPGCLFAYVVATTSDSPIAGAWTVDYGSRDLIDATEAYFVLITDADAVDDPMKINPRAFADEDDALEFVDEWDAEDLSEDDVIGLDDVDRETAEIYRGNRM